MGYLTYEDGTSGRIRVVNPQYLPYVTYQDMGGTLDESTFDNFEYEAETIVNWYTFNRLKEDAPETYPEELARCMYRIIDLLKLKADALTLGAQTTTTDDGQGHVSTVTTSPYISSQSNDGVSVSYNTIGVGNLLDRLGINKKDSMFEDIVFRYLQGVRNSKGKRLTYRGLYPDE